VVGTGRGNEFETLEFAAGIFPGLLRETSGFQALSQILDLFLCAAFLAEFLLNGPELFAEVRRASVPR